MLFALADGTTQSDCVPDDDDGGAGRGDAGAGKREEGEDGRVTLNRQERRLLGDRDLQRRRQQADRVRQLRVAQGAGAVT
jgi:hypothetical protein